jgi:ribosomal protein S15P/S13E
MLEKRRKLLKFMKRKNFEEFKVTLAALGLKDRY